jgi:hypothetical protein
MSLKSAENTFLQTPKSGSSCRMTPDSPPARRAYRRLRVPAFYPVPTRTRRDGWTIERQADFLGMLAETGSVIGACEAVGMSRKSAYRLGTLPGAESFAAAWDAALGGEVRKVTRPACNIFFDCLGPVRLVTFRGRYRGAWRNAANGTLISHVWQPGRAGQGHNCIPDGDSAAPRTATPRKRAVFARDRVTCVNTPTANSAAVQNPLRSNRLCSPGERP